MPEEIAIEALFLALFDDHKGQSLIWTSSHHDTKELEGLEFQALPSGLHLVETDTFYFHHASSSTQGRTGRLGVAVFHNKELDPDETKQAGKETGGRGRLMLSLGVLMGENSTSTLDFPPLSGLRNLVARISNEWDYTLTGAQGETARQAWLDGLLDPFWVQHRSIAPSPSSSGRVVGTRSAFQALSDGSLGLSTDHPVHYCDTLFDHFDANTCTLWKYAMTNRRILFFSHTPLEPACKAAWCTWMLGQTVDVGFEKSMFLGSIGLMDMSKIQGIKGGWIACTSDAIFKDRPQLWDLLVDLGSNPLPSSSTTLETVPSLGASTFTPMRARYVPENVTIEPTSKPTIYTKSISHTFSDKALWKDVQGVLSVREDEQGQPVSRETDRPSPGVWGYAYGAYSTLCEVCWGFCAMAVGMGGRGEHAHPGGTGYIRLPRDGDVVLESEDEEEVGDEAATRSGGQNGLQHTTAALDVFRKRAARLISKIDKLGSKGALSKDDMAAFGLSAWSWVDVDFVRALHAIKVRRDGQDRVDEGTTTPDIQVEKGWFRWVSSIIGA